MNPQGKKNANHDRTGLKNRAIAVVLIFLAAVCAAVYSGHRVRSKCARIMITEFSRLPAVNLSEDETGLYTATADDPYFEITGLDTHVQSVEIVADALQNGQHTMQVYYNTGAGYSEWESVKTAIHPGRNFVSLGESPYVYSLRLDLLNSRGESIRLSGIVVNPSHKANVLPVLLTGIAFAAAVIVMSGKTGSPLRLTVIAAVVSALLLFAGGLPVILYEKSIILPAFFVLEGLGFAVLSSILFMREGTRKRRIVTGLLMTFSFLICFFWALRTPFDTVPDERMHYDVVQFLTQYHFIPRGDDPRIRDSVWGFSYTFNPILPFMIGSVFQSMTKIFTGGSLALLMSARMVSILSSGLTVLFASLTGCVLFPKSRAKYIMPVFVACYPEFLFLCTYVNSDAFAIMTTSMIVYFWASGIKNGWRYRDGFGLAVGMGLCALSYYNCYGFILLSIPVFFFTIHRTGRDRRYILRLTAFIVVCTLAICGWWFIRNAVLYDGDFLARNAINKSQELYAANEHKPSVARSLYSEGYSLGDMFFEKHWLGSTVYSFIGVFGVLSLYVRRPVMVMYRTFFVTGIIGTLGVLLYRLGTRKRRGPEAMLMSTFHVNMIFSILIPCGLAVYYSYMVDFQAQGRYLMPVLIPVAYFTALEYEEIGGLAGQLFSRIQAGKSGQRDKVLKNAPGSGGTARLICALIPMVFSVLLVINIVLDTVFAYYM